MFSVVSKRNCTQYRNSWRLSNTVVSEEWLNGGIEKETKINS